MNTSTMKFRYIPVDQIYTTKNIRKELDTDIAGLISSLDKYDVIQPILVRPTGLKYEVVVGHRRFRALKSQGVDLIPCVVRRDIDKNMRVQIQLDENMCRKPLSAYEITCALDSIKKITGESNAKIAHRLGKSVSWVTNQYNSLKLAEGMYGEKEAKKVVKKCTAGQIIGKAETSGYYGERKENKRLRMLRRGNKLELYSVDSAIIDNIVQYLKRKYFNGK